MPWPNVGRENRRTRAEEKAGEGELEEDTEFWGAEFRGPREEGREGFLVCVWVGERGLSSWRRRARACKAGFGFVVSLEFCELLGLTSLYSIEKGMKVGFIPYDVCVHVYAWNSCNV